MKKIIIALTILLSASTMVIANDYDIFYGRSQEAREALKSTSRELANSGSEEEEINFLPIGEGAWILAALAGGYAFLKKRRRKE